ncbi:hypothetical protein [Curtobacterium sp. MWU13-2055]|uniref:hypothetical protein n=1 Tax=Curtobacterium sp. MWU13-2055 TaxID=2931928 RepID=UPI00200C7648|nr:hypothetical protein [Curtobacterium sp. MWU13-2055]
MISLDGATLLATIFPIVIVLLVFERRRPKIPRPVDAWVRFLIRFADWAVATGAIFGLSATALCIVAVASGVPLQGVSAVWVTLCGSLLGIAGMGAVGAGLSERMFDPWE